jgi:hypothetical protein
VGQSIGESEAEPGAESDAQLSTESSAEPAGAQSSIEPDAGSRTRLNAEPSSAELNVEPSLSSAQVRKVSEGESEKPKHRCKRLLIVCGILVVVAVVALISLAIIGGKHFGSSSNYRPNSPEDIMVRYLHDKYGKDFVLTGKIRRTPFGSSALWEHYYESDAYPVDDPRLRFKVKLDGDNKEHKFEKSDTYIEEGQILAEEDRLRPYVERIFGKNTEIGVKYKLCDRGEDSMKGSHDLPKAMNICKQETADMTKEEIIDSDIDNENGLSHQYTVYIYARDRQSIKTTDDKTKIIKGLKELVKYLPDINPDLLSLYYFIRGDKSSDEGSELALSAKDLSDQGIRSLVHDFNSKLATVGPAARSGITYWEITMPGKKGWLKLDDDE